MTGPPARTRLHRQYQPLIDPYKEYLVKRWNDSCRNAQVVSREIIEQGYTGSDQLVVRFFAQLREKKDMRTFKQVDTRKRSLFQGTQLRFHNVNGGFQVAAPSQETQRRAQCLWWSARDREERGAGEIKGESACFFSFKKVCYT